MYSGKFVLFGQKWLYSGKYGSICAKEVVLGQKLLYSGKVIVFVQKLIYLGKIGSIRAEVVLFGQRWL